MTGRSPAGASAAHLSPVATSKGPEPAGKRLPPPAEGTVSTRHINLLMKFVFNPTQQIITLDSRDILMGILMGVSVPERERAD